MAGFNGSGTFVRTHDWTTDLSNTVPVTASRMDAEDDGFATGLSNTICRDGQSTTTARIPFAAGLSAAAGTTASVSYAQTNDNNTGLYFPGSDQWGLVAGGTAVLTGTATGVAVTGTLTTSGALTPSASDGAALGSSSVMWSDLFLASGSVINFNNGNVTVTHSANALAFAGGAVSYDAQVTISSGGAAITGNSTVTGTLGVSSDFAVNTNKFTVAGASGNTVIAGTLGVTGDVAVNTNKFTVAASSGNTVVAGTLAVTGATTQTGALTANNSAGVAARNTGKLFVTFTTDGSSNITVAGTAFNVASVAAQSVASQNGFRITATNAFSGANYTVVARANRDTDVTELCGVICRNQDKTTTTIDIIVTTESTSSTRSNLTVDVAVFENA